MENAPSESVPHEQQISEASIYTACIQQLYAAAAPGIIANFMVGGILVWSLWGEVRDSLLIGWFFANGTINLARYLMIARALQRSQITPTTWKRWALRHAITTGAISGVWCFAIVTFALSEEIFLTFFILAVAGLTAGALPIVSLYYVSYLAYALPLVGGLTWRILLSSSSLTLPMAVLTILYAVTIMATSKHFSKSLINTITLQMQLDALAHTDGLTGLANRRAFEERLREEWFRMMRRKDPLSLIILDLDYFKKYNDSLGHQAGDACLTRLGQCIQSVFRRSSDFPTRLGGEEFAILLPETPSKAAEALAEAVRSAVEGMRIVHPDSPFEFVTVSIGVHTALPTAEIKLTSLYLSADQALYQSKNAGRNRVTVNRTSEPRPEV